MASSLNNLTPLHSVLQTIVVLCVIIHCVTYACIFPPNLQHHNWHYKIIKSQNRQTIVSFTDRKITMKEQLINEKRTISSVSYQCEEIMGARKYLVTESSSDGFSRYKCIEFIERSDSVYQLRMSESSYEKEGLCVHSSLHLDPWLMISFSQMEKTFTTCPFAGGYNMKIWDSSGYPHGCNSMDLPMRFETECIKGEGISFNFRKKDCVDFMPMEKFQKAFCHAHWKKGKYNFVVLKKPGHEEVWIMRFPRKVLGYSMEIGLFTDVAAIVTGNPDEDVIYFTLSIHKVIQTDLCSDEYSRCETMTCNSYLMDQCPKSCQKCNPSKRTPVCSFPAKLRGEWLLQDTSGTSEVNISESYFEISSIGLFKCVSFSDSPPYEKNKFTTISSFQNGCRPRYTCLNFKRLSESVLGFSLSQSYIWPFHVENPGTLICEEGRFEPDPDPVRDVYRSYLNTVKPLLPVSRQLLPVTCDLQSSFSFQAKISGVGSCNGYLYKDCSNTSIIQILFNNCHNYPKHLTYFCAANNIASYYWEKLILLQNLENPLDGGCLAFTQMHPNKAVLLRPAQCDMYTWTFVESKVRQPIIHFNVKEETSSCRNMPTTTTTTTGLPPVKDSMVDESPKTRSKGPNSAHYHENEKTPSYYVTPDRSTIRNIPSLNINKNNILSNQNSGGHQPHFSILFYLTSTLILIFIYDCS